MRKVTSIVLTFIMIVSLILACGVFASADTGVVEKDGVMQMGDFKTITEGYIIYYPIGMENSNTKYPVVVWANGTMCAPALYYDLLIGVAKQGFIVIASPELMSKDGKGQCAAIDYIMAQNEDKTSPFYGKVDKNKIGAFGHSQGGLSSVNAAVADSRIKAIVSIAGASTGDETANLKVPSLFLTGTLDTIVLSALWVKPSYEGCPAPAAYASLKGGVHTSCIVSADTYINYTVKWFNAWFTKNGDKSVFKDGGEMSKDSKWTDFKYKNYDVNLSGSIFGEASTWMIIALAAVIVAVCVVVIKKRKAPKTGAVE